MNFSTLITRTIIIMGILESSEELVEFMADIAEKTADHLEEVELTDKKEDKDDET